LIDAYRARPDASPFVLLPDPLYRFGSPSPSGTQMVQTLGLDFDFDFASRPHFLRSGDVHNDERLRHDKRCTSWPRAAVRSGIPRQCSSAG
jgi:hypothetical protein